MENTEKNGILINDRVIPYNKYYGIRYEGKPVIKMEFAAEDLAEIRNFDEKFPTALAHNKSIELDVTLITESDTITVRFNPEIWDITSHDYFVDLDQFLCSVQHKIDFS